MVGRHAQSGGEIARRDALGVARQGAHDGVQGHAHCPLPTRNPIAFVPSILAVAEGRFGGFLILVAATCWRRLSFARCASICSRVMPMVRSRKAGMARGSVMSPS